MKVGVTGASGFIGMAVCRVLKQAGHEAVAIVARGGGDFAGIQANDALVHLAGIAHRRGAALDELLRVNVQLTEQLGGRAAECGMPMLFVSSLKVHGDESRSPIREDSPFAPGDEYARSKVLAEERLRAIRGLTLTVLRPPLVYGPMVKANFLALLNAVARGIPLPLRSIANRRSLVYVDNLAHAILACLEKPPAAKRAFLVSDGPPISTPQLCTELGAALGRPARLVSFPVAALEMFSAARRLTRSFEVDDSAIRRALDWQPPFGRKAGLQATADWYRGR